MPVIAPSHGRQYSLTNLLGKVRLAVFIMFSKFRNSDLAMIALVLEEEEETERVRKRRVWVDSAWKSRPAEGEFITLFPRLMDDEIKFY